MSKMSKKGNNIQPKIFINGKLNRKKHKYILRSLALLESINAEIQQYCRGGENAILNYLIKEGLKSVKSFNFIIDIKAEDIEEDAERK